MLQMRTWKFPTPVAGGLCLLLLASFSGGCGKSVGDVKGRVTYLNKPVPDGTVRVRGSDGLIHNGAIAAGGDYLVKHVPLGPAQVLVSSVDPKMAEAMKRLVDRRDTSQAGVRAPVPHENLHAKYSRIPLVYGSFESSGLKLEVQAGENELNLALK